MGLVEAVLPRLVFLVLPSAFLLCAELTEDAVDDDDDDDDPSEFSARLSPDFGDDPNATLLFLLVAGIGLVS